MFDQSPDRLLSVIRTLLTKVRDAFTERFVTNTRDFLVQRQPLVWVLALVVGITLAYAAIAFRWLIGIIQLPWLGTATENVASAAAATPWIIVVAVPAFSGIVVGLLLEKFVPTRRPHSVADVIESCAIRTSRLDFRTGLWSALLAAFSIGSGASVGREGPIVHFGATLAAAIQDRFTLSSSARRTLIACGAAAAVSASFNAPLAGVLFAHEVILTHYAFRALVPIVIASVTGAVIARIHFGDTPAFMVPEFHISSYLEFPAFALLGLTCAVVAILFQFALIATDRVTWRFQIPLWLRGGVGGLCVGTLGVFLPQILGVGYETTNEALSRDLSLGFLLILIVAKTAATAVSLASRFAGGVFSPSLYLGAMTGAAFGIIATSVFPELGSGQSVYALLGMGAVAGAVLGAPLSTVLIVFELTGGYEMTIALLLTVSIAVGLTQAFLGHSFFHWQLGKRGLFLNQGPHQSIMRQLRVADFMEPVNDGELIDQSNEGEEQPWLMPNDDLERALRLFDREGKPQIAVVSETDPTRIIGWAHRIRALSLFNKALIDAHVEAHR